MSTAMKYVCLFLLGATCFCGKLAAGRIRTLSLWYDRPASRWGRGASAGQRPPGRYGIRGLRTRGACRLNEETIWAGGPHNNVNPAAREALPEVRRLIFEGRYKEAFDLCDENFSLHASHGMPYQTAGSLLLDFPGHRNVSDFYRDLDLATATATVGYAVDGIRYKREMFTFFRSGGGRAADGFRTAPDFVPDFVRYPDAELPGNHAGERPAADRRQNRRS